MVLQRGIRCSTVSFEAFDSKIRLVRKKQAIENSLLKPSFEKARISW